MFDAAGQFRPLGFFRMWWPFITLPGEALHWAMKVPCCIHTYGIFRDNGFGPHSGLFIGVGLYTVAEVAATGLSERWGVHMGLRQIKSYKESLRISVQARGNFLGGAYAGAGGLWLRNFAWNYAFLEWKRFFHNAVDKTPDWAPGLFCQHLDWLRRLDKKDQANLLTFYSANFATYLTFFNMAGDNIKTKMSHDPARYPSFFGTAREIASSHGILGFTRGGLFKGIYLVAGSTLAVGIQERLTHMVAALQR
jgi:hypothetical protein